MLLSACAAPGSLPVADGRLDGVYTGVRTEDPRCGTARQSMKFQVAGNLIVVRSRHARQDLAGTLSADGQFALQDGDGKRRIDGVIRDGALSAAELVGPGGNGKHRRGSVDDPTALSCMWRYEAARS